MELSLKDQNKPMLALVLAVNILIYLIIVQKWYAPNDWDWIDNFTNIQELAPVLLFSIFTGIMNAQIGHDNKARLIFWNWSNPLPGSRAFSEYMDRDSRIDGSHLREQYGPLPLEPDKQNALWFKWYREYQNEPGIKQVHREYLFTRDYACTALILAIGLGCLGLWQIESPTTSIAYIGILAAQYILVRRAAFNHGVRFVCSVLAYKASSEYQNR